ncbi:MAG: STAS domain-containing protein [Candidatus Cyclobacteriaceae bacterium M3_2C_046]
MKYKHEIKEDVVILHLEGDLIGENQGTEIIEMINDFLNEDIRLAAVDISQLRYINSSGIGVLITILTKFRNKEGEVVLIKPSEQVKKLLIITKLNSIFTIVENKAEAIKVLKKNK